MFKNIILILICFFGYAAYGKDHVSSTSLIAKDIEWIARDHVGLYRYLSVGHHQALNEKEKLFVLDKMLGRLLYWRKRVVLSPEFAEMAHALASNNKKAALCLLEEGSCADINELIDVSLAPSVIRLCHEIVRYQERNENKLSYDQAVLFIDSLAKQKILNVVR